jgi:hypothetical protein
MAFVAAATSVGAAVLGTGAAAGIGSTLVGGALIGAGIGGAYSALTGDGNILNSMLTGGLIGGVGAGLGSAMGLGAKAGAGASGLTPAAAASAPSTLAAPTANVMTVTPAMQAAALDAAAVAEGATTAGMVPAANTGLAANTVLPASMTFTPPATQAAAGLKGKQMLGYGLAGSAALSLLGGMNQPKIQAQSQSPSYIRPYTYSSTQTPATGIYPSPYATTQYDAQGNPIMDTRERNYFDQGYTAQPVYQAAGGGLMSPGVVENMSTKDMMPGMYPQGMMDKTYYSTPTQRPATMEVVRSDYDAPMNPMTGLPPIRMNDGGITYDPKTQTYSGLPERGGGGGASPLTSFDPAILEQWQAANPNVYAYDPAAQRYSAGRPSQAQYDAFLKAQEEERMSNLLGGGMMGWFGGASGFPGFAMGGDTAQYNLGGYSDGGRLLKGPGDGVSDDIPAMIGQKQPARLADGEFVIPARIVSEIGNGSTDAGAKRLYAMMDRVQAKRQKSAKKGKFAMNTKAEKELPA